jgi:hypothetical protein
LLLLLLMKMWKMIMKVIGLALRLHRPAAAGFGF